MVQAEANTFEFDEVLGYRVRQNVSYSHYLGLLLYMAAEGKGSELIPSETPAAGNQVKTMLELMFPY